MGRGCEESKKQSLYTGGNIQNVVKEMIRLDVKIMGISETHWPSTGSCQIQEHMVYYSGNENPTHRNRLGIVVTKEINALIKTIQKDYLYENKFVLLINI